MTVYDNPLPRRPAPRAAQPPQAQPPATRSPAAAAADPVAPPQVPARAVTTPEPHPSAGSGSPEPTTHQGPHVDEHADPDAAAKEASRQAIAAVRQRVDEADAMRPRLVAALQRKAAEIAAAYWHGIVVARRTPRDEAAQAAAGSEPGLPKSLRLGTTSLEYNVAGHVEGLMKELMTLDGIESFGDATIRADRKAQVARVQRGIDDGDVVLSKAKRVTALMQGAHVRLGHALGRFERAAEAAAADTATRGDTVADTELEADTADASMTASISDASMSQSQEMDDSAGIGAADAGGDDDADDSESEAVAGAGEASDDDLICDCPDCAARAAYARKHAEYLRAHDARQRQLHEARKLAQQRELLRRQTAARRAAANADARSREFALRARRAQQQEAQAEREARAYARQRRDAQSRGRIYEDEYGRQYVLRDPEPVRQAEPRIVGYDVFGNPVRAASSAPQQRYSRPAAPRGYGGLPYGLVW